MRVLHVIAGIDPARGGPTAALKGLAEAQAAVGLDVTVMASWPDGEHLHPAEYLRDKGIEVELVGPARTPLQIHPLITPTLDRLVRQSDVVHIHTLWEQVQHKAAQMAARHLVPYIMRPAGMLDPWSLAQRRWKKRLYMVWRLRKNLNRAKGIHFTSEPERDLARPLGLNPREIVIPNGIDLQEFDPLPPLGSFRGQFPAIGDRRIVLFLSRLHYKKGLDLIVPAFAAAASDDTVLVIAGPDRDGYRAKVEDDVDAHGISDRVIFTGMLTGADRIAPMVDADLFILPSYQENFGIAVVEALAAGTPVIISDQVNIWKEIQAGGVGQVVPTEVEPLAEVLRGWLADDARRSAAAARCRSFAKDRYDWHRIAQRWADEYAELIL